MDFAYDLIFEMASTGRHRRIVDALYQNRHPVKFKGRDNTALVYEEGICLIDVTEMNRYQLDVLNTGISALYWVEPDYFYFEGNAYFTDSDELKTAGCPDLITEVWSAGNSPAHRDFKKKLYMTGKNTEHWYFEQHSNTVECWLGSKRLENKDLMQPLITCRGVQFNLIALAINK